MKIRSLLFLAILLAVGCTPGNKEKYVSLSGIYPHLASYNKEGECGTGAVVPWAEKLWVITYGPHLPKGSSDKLYEINSRLDMNVREESIGGTPANRMIHRESGQLFIGPYVIGDTGQVRVIPYAVMPGRLTGNARHLTDPAGKVYYGTMEEGFYEVDVNSLAVTTLYPDGNFVRQEGKGAGPQNDLLPGVHGKGLYSGQGVMVFSNNGEGSYEALQKFDVEAGVLAEWDGKDWNMVRRNQFVEVTGPGGIYGNPNPATDPLWATGWDHKSVLLGVRDARRGWTFFRLPKASHSYDGAHGWNTEWPRIRNVGTTDRADYLMTMHGMFWRFPATFSAEHPAGIRPRSAYLKVIGDFARWNGRLVFGCDDSAQKEFLNTRKAKGTLGGPGQSNSNLWFTSPSTPDELGPATADGAVWSKERVEAGTCSEPFLFAGWPGRVCWMENDGKEEVTFAFEVDEAGNGVWKEIGKAAVPAGKAGLLHFDSGEKGEWIRVRVNEPSVVSVSFNYTSADHRGTDADALFGGLAPVVSGGKIYEGLLYALGGDRRVLGVLARTAENGGVVETGYYELNDRLQLLRKDDSVTTSLIRSKFAIPAGVVTIDNSSVLVIDDKGRRWRLPLGNEAYTGLTDGGFLRVCREVATERDLFNCHGTFYELPAENADGYAKIRPVASHNFHIHDYASYRGLLVMTGIAPEAAGNNEHIIVSDDGKAAVWAGTIDDLWRMGKPVGHGGPWYRTEVKAGDVSDSYLIGFYDRKTLELSHEGADSVSFTVEVDPSGSGDFIEYATYRVAAGEKYSVEFPAFFQARWIRFTSDADVKATAWLEYR